MRARLTALFQVRPGEERLAGLVIVLFLLPSMGGAIGSAGVEALFYTRFGVEFLPYMYVALGLATIAAAFFITALLGRVAKKVLYLMVPLVLALAWILSRVLVSADLGWVYPLLWLGMFLSWTMQGLFTWGLAGTLCDTRQAKRLFPLFGAGGILGIALGGLITRPLVQLAGTANLLLVWAGSLVGCLVLIWMLIGNLPVARSIPSHRLHPTVMDDLRQGFDTVRSSRLLRWNAVAVVLFAMLMFSLAFPFATAVATQFPDEDAMAGFLGIFTGITTSVAFLLSLMLANRFYARFGFSRAALVLALIYLAGFSALAINASFGLLAAFRFAQIAWIQGVSDSARQAALNIVPSERREPTRAFVDGILAQLGVVLIGLLLITGQESLQARHLFILGVATAAGAAWIVTRAGRAFRSALIDALRLGQASLFPDEEEPFGGFQQDAMAVRTVIAGLGDPNPAVRRVSVQVLGRLSVPAAAEALVEALTDEDAAVRAAALRGLAKAEASSALLEVAQCLSDPDAMVRQEAVDALVQLTPFSRGAMAQIESLLSDPDAAVRAKVAATLLRSANGSSDGQDRRQAALELVRSMACSPEERERAMALLALAQWGDGQGYDLAARGLMDSKPSVRRAAAEALAAIDASRCVQPLIRTLGDPEPSVRTAAARALGAIGQPALYATAAALAEPELQDGVLQALAHLPTYQEADAVRSYAIDRIERALRYHGVWLRAFPHASTDPRMALLSDSVRESVLRDAQRALRAIGSLGDPEAMELVINNLESTSPNQRANALETLEALGQRDVVRPLLAVWETPTMPARGSGSSGNHEWLLILMRDGDEWIRATAALAAGGLDSVGVQEQLAQLAQSDPVSLVRSTADDVLNRKHAVDGGGDLKTLPTLSIMERVLLLRRVPIFADLPPAELRQLASIAGEHYFGEGGIVVREGELGDEMYIIASGQVRVVRALGEDDEVELAVRGAGEYVGEMAIISHEPRMASLVALGDVRLLCIEQNQFETLLRERPEISLGVMRALIQRLQRNW